MLPLTLDIEANARGTDPGTSHDAAVSVGDLTAKRRAVLALIQYAGPGTLEDYVEAYRRNRILLHLPHQSESGIRTRVSELQKLGKVIDTGERRQMRSGRFARVLTHTA